MTEPIWEQIFGTLSDEEKTLIEQDILVYDTCITHTDEHGNSKRVPPDEWSGLKGL